MPDLTEYLGFLAFWVLASIPLGPNAINSIRHGASAAGARWIFAPLGTTVAAMFFCAIVLLGFGVFVSERPMLQSVIQVLGACYLTYLGLAILIRVYKRGLGKSIDINGDMLSDRPFRDGFLISITNPKPIILYSSVLSTYLDLEQLVSRHNTIILIVTISVVFFVYLGYGLLGRMARHIFGNDRLFLTIDIAAGSSFLLLAIVILTSALG